MKIEKLLEKVKAGDTDALKIIYERYSPMMRSICFSITKEDEDTKMTSSRTLLSLHITH